MNQLNFIPEYKEYLGLGSPRETLIYIKWQSLITRLHVWQWGPTKMSENLPNYPVGCQGQCMFKELCQSPPLSQVMYPEPRDILQTRLGGE